MAKFKTEAFDVQNEAGAVYSAKVSVQISAAGWFYCLLPQELLAAFEGHPGVNAQSRAKGMFQVEASTFEELRSRVHAGLQRFMQPQVQETPVILYNLESHVSFAEQSDGTLVPNAGWPDAQWPKSKAFGDHHAAHPSKNGYSLTVGARAMLKRVVRYGTQEKVSYSRWYKGGHHLDHDNPAQLLNSWMSFSLDESHCKEIPYSDEAAMFFHQLMLGMAALSRQLQAATFEQDKLLALIARGGAGLLPAPSASERLA